MIFDLIAIFIAFSAGLIAGLLITSIVQGFGK